MSFIATLFISIVPICYVALKLGGSPIIVFQIQLFLYIVAHFMRIVIVSKQIYFSKKEYFVKVITPVMSTATPTFILCYLFSFLFSDTIVAVLGYGIFCFVLIAIIIMTFGITRNERRTIINLIRKRLYKND